MGLTLLGTSVMPLNIWQVALYSERRKAEEVSKQNVAYSGDDFQTVAYTTVS